MASWVAQKGTATSVTTTLQVSITGATVPVGDVVTLRIATANTGGGGAARTISSVVDSRSNTWVRVGTNNVDPGAVDAGCTQHFYYAVIVNAMQAGAATTITFSGANTNAGAVIDHWSGLDTAAMPAADSGIMATAATAALTAAVLATPNSSGDLVIVHNAWRNTTDVFTADTDTLQGTWSKLTQMKATNWHSDLQYKLVTGTSQQSNQATVPASTPSCSLAVVFRWGATKVNPDYGGGNSVWATAPTIRASANLLPSDADGIGAAYDATVDIPAPATNADAALGAGAALDATTTSAAAAFVAAGAASALGTISAPYDNVRINDAAAPSFDPLSLGGLSIWLDASQLGLADGTAVSPWPNYGSAVDAAILGSPAPVVKTGILNGLPVMRFTNAEGRVRSSGTGAAEAGLNWTVIYVARIRDASMGRVVGAIYQPSNLLIGFWNGFENVAYVEGFLTPDQRRAQTTEWRLYTGTGEGVSGDAKAWFYENGVFQAGNHPVTGGWQDTLAISGYDTTTAETPNCDVAELLFYDHRLTDTDRQTVESYLRTKWGLP